MMRRSLSAACGGSGPLVICRKPEDAAFHLTRSGTWTFNPRIASVSMSSR
jgi:hypothetical protein